MKLIRTTIGAKARRILGLVLASALLPLLVTGCFAKEPGESMLPGQSATTSGETTGETSGETTDDPASAVRHLTDRAIFLALDEKDPIPANWLAGRSTPIPGERNLQDAIQDFSRKSFELMAKDHIELNLLMSPLSLYVDLAMLGEGTAGETRAEIAAALAGTRDDSGSDFLELSRSAISKLLGGMNMSREKYVMKTGQSLWFRPDIPIRDSYLDLLEEHYYTEAFLADFAADPALVKKEMGAWVSDKTAGLLGDDLPVQIKPSDVMYLLQTLYFKDSWMMPFSESMTEQGSFRTTDGQTKFIPVMKQSLLPAWGYKGDGYQAAELLTEQGFAMRVILPDEVASLDSVLAIEDLYDVLFSDHLLEQEGNALWESNWQVNWLMPRFDVKADIDLKGLLGKLGVSAVMGPAADFSKAADVMPGAFFLDTAKQQVRIKVDEKGVEAAAVTIFGVAESMPQLQGTIDMKLDRPFLFSITTPAGLPLFMAWVGDVDAA